MAATRRFFRSEAVAEAILARLPEKLAFVRVLPDMRFIEYDVGGMFRAPPEVRVFPLFSPARGEPSG
jgi:hypothetical protein